MFNHGALCHELTTKGSNPIITDTSYILILVKNCRESGVFPIEIREWSHLPETDKTVERCMAFFTEVYEIWMEETLQGVLAANAASRANAALPLQGTPTALVTRKWDYCWTHGLCQHSSTTC